MARSASSQSSQSAESSTGATCETCGRKFRRVTDLPRHMLIHAKNKEEFMFTCPVEGCTHQTLQRSNLATHIRTHTRAKPHKCPEYFPNGQKCDFATADPSSLHRHRKRKHGYKPRSLVNVSMASGSGAREESVESSTSFESEESFGLRPEASDPVDASEPPNMSSYPLHPYLTSEKVSVQRYPAPYLPPLDFKAPVWINSPVSSSQSLSCDYNNTSAPPLALSQSELWECGAAWSSLLMSPDLNNDDSWGYYNSSKSSGYSSPSSPSVSTPSSLRYPLDNSSMLFLDDLAAFYPEMSSAELWKVNTDSSTSLSLPPHLFPSAVQHCSTPEWQGF